MSKVVDLFASLAEWRTVQELTAETGWKPHTLRAVISVRSRKDGVSVERRRIDGVTSYRIKPPEYDADDDIRKSVQVGLAAIKERMAAGGPAWPPESETA